MKRLTFLILTLIATPALAEDKQATCKVVGDMAENVMTQRQGGATMSAMLEVYAQELSAVPAAVDHISKLTLLAFEQPLFSTDEAKKKAVIEFRNQAELGCFKST